MVRKFNSQTLILIGSSLLVLHLAGIPLVMLLYGSIRSAPIGEPGATYTIQNYIAGHRSWQMEIRNLRAVVSCLFPGRDLSCLRSALVVFHPLLWGSVAGADGENDLSTVLSIMAFDLWEGGQYTYVSALGVLMVLVLVTRAFTARKLGTRVGIAD